MNLLFDIRDKRDPYEIDDAAYTAVTTRYPDWTFPADACGLQDMVLQAPCWNPVEMMPLDLVYGHYIVKFAKFALMNPDVQRPRDAVWRLTGDFTTLVGKFDRDGFRALPPTDEDVA